MNPSSPKFSWWPGAQSAGCVLGPGRFRLRCPELASTKAKSRQHVCGRSAKFLPASRKTRSTCRERHMQRGQQLDCHGRNTLFFRLFGGSRKVFASRAKVGFMGQTCRSLKSFGLQHQEPRDFETSDDTVENSRMAFLSVRQYLGSGGRRNLQVRLLRFVWRNSKLVRHVQQAL